MKAFDEAFKRFYNKNRHTLRCEVNVEKPASVAAIFTLLMVVPLHTTFSSLVSCLLRKWRVNWLPILVIGRKLKGLSLQREIIEKLLKAQNNHKTDNEHG